jgi:outer membrane protein assembly factor BamA
MHRRWKLTAPIFPVLLLFSCIVLTFSGFAQDSPASEAGTRMEGMVEQQKKKAKDLRPAQPQKAEQALEKYVGEDPMNKYLGGIGGLHLRFGGLSSGAGFGLGPEYYRPDLAKGQMTFRAFGGGTIRQWYLLETEVRFPHIAGRFLELGLRGHRLDANSIDYYGPGPDSSKAVRTNYRREENELAMDLAFKPLRRYLSIGFVAGYLWLNTGPGQSELYASSEKQFSPSMAPGIDKQTHYLQTGLFLDVDSRDKPKDPHGGTHFRVEFNRFDDRKHDQYSFQQIESSLEQYIPFLNKKRVLALRAHSVLSYPFHGNQVPFYMQPTLGGSSDLRGYRRYRFYDDNSFLMSAEYRWEVFTLMDAAVFADAGKVFHKDGDFNLEKIESDAGFGLRFKSREAVAFRIDTAFSQEGFGLWVTFDHAF